MSVATGLSLSTSFGLAETPFKHGFQLDTVDPAPAGDRFLLVPEARTERPNNGPRDKNGELQPRRDLSVRMTWAMDPLSLTNSGSDAKQHRWTNRMHLGGAWGLYSWLLTYIDVPIIVLQSAFNDLANGYQPSGSEGAYGRQPDFGDVGDIRAGFRVRPHSISRTGRTVDIGAGASAWLPTGDQRSLTGDPPFRFDVNLFSVTEETSWHHFHLLCTQFFGWEHRRRQDLGAASHPSVLGSGVEAGIGASLFLDEMLHAFTFELRGSQLDDTSHLFAIIGGGVRFIPSNIVSANFNSFWGLSGVPGVPAWGSSVGIDFTPAAPVPSKKKVSKHQQAPASTLR